MGPDGWFSFRVDPGIGKTTSSRAFLDSIAGEPGLRIARGPCVDEYRAGDACRPVLDGLTQVCREPGGEPTLEILHRLAPTWLVGMPSLVSAEDRVRLQGQVQGATRDRMLRRNGGGARSDRHPSTSMALFIEDLHGVTPLTLELIRAIARRSAPAPRDDRRDLSAGRNARAGASAARVEAGARAP